MELFLFLLNSILFGIGLAMDAFSVSLANGLAEPQMKMGRRCLISGTFAGFQILMPLLGYLFVHTLAKTFTVIQKFIPWTALVLLGFIGGKMLYEGFSKKGGKDAERGKETSEKPAVGFLTLMLQGIATSIDALSVGLTIAELSPGKAILESLIIGIVTFGICMGGIFLGRKFGLKLAGKATIFGGFILIFIGLEIFLTGIL